MSKFYAAKTHLFAVSNSGAIELCDIRHEFIHFFFYVSAFARMAGTKIAAFQHEERPMATSDGRAIELYIFQHELINISLIVFMFAGMA